MFIKFYKLFWFEFYLFHSSKPTEIKNKKPKEIWEIVNFCKHIKLLNRLPYIQRRVEDLFKLGQKKIHFQIRKIAELYIEIYWKMKLFINSQWLTYRQSRFVILIMIICHQFSQTSKIMFYRIIFSDLKNYDFRL